MSKDMKKQNIVIVFVALLFLVSIGYATLNANLSINGTSKIKNSTWNVHFNNPVVSTGSVPIDTSLYSSAKAVTKDSATQVSYNVLLNEPGDFYEFTVEVENEGSIDAMIDTISSKLNNVEITTLPAYLNYSVTYSDDKPILAKHQLNAGTVEEYKVRVEFKKDISASDLPSTAQELNLIFSVIYIQKDSTAIPVTHPITRYSVYMSYGAFTLGQELPSDALLRLTPNEAMADWNNMGVTNNSLYTKHVIENNVLKESYVGVVISSELASTHQGMIPGTYEFRGYTDSTYYNENVELLKTAFGYSTDSSRCGVDPYDSSLFVCEVGSGPYIVAGYISSSGNVQINYYRGKYCYVFDGVSLCSSDD